MLGPFLPAAGCDPSQHPAVHPLPHCELWSSAVALRGAQAPQPLTGKWQLVQQGVDVSLGLLGREQRSGEEPWLCLASCCLCCWLPTPHSCCPAWARVAGRRWDAAHGYGCVTAPLDPEQQCHQTQSCWVKASCSPLLGSRAMAPSSAPQPQRLLVPLRPTVMCRCTAGDSPEDNGKGAAAGRLCDLMGPALLSFSRVRSGVTWHLRLGLLCLPEH